MSKVLWNHLGSAESPDRTEGGHSGPELKILCNLQNFIQNFNDGFRLNNFLSLFSKLHKILNSGPLCGGGGRVEGGDLKTGERGERIFVFHL